MAISWNHGERIKIYVSEKENSAVKNAVHNLCEDFDRTIGCTGELFPIEQWEEGEKNSIRIASLDADGMAETDAFRQEAMEIGMEKMSGANGKLRPEAYCQKVSGSSLLILGSDRRGTVYGIYQLSEMLGVSAWHYFADVVPKKKESFALAADYEKTDWPDVAYRGIFLNDEEELEAWAKKHTKDGTIGPEAYGHIYELLLRLGGNYLWPAMHVNYFNENPENGRLADEMGIVIGTSHCDMLLRSNQNEWDPWLKKKGYSDIRYDYSISERNREILREYWTESVQMNREYEACYTVGMRGIHDYGFSTLGIDGDAALPEAEKNKKRVELLGDIIRDQRQILKDVLGEEKASRALQTFIPYKEVLPLYDAGLDLPEDITLMWVDDNFGYVRRYPSEQEGKRAGGHGLYYHVSYWAHPGMSYLFIGSIPLRQIASELRKCYESNIRKIWVLNVGALKPLEQEIEFFIRYGWEAGRENGITKDAARFTADWVNRNFTGQHGEEIAPLYERFAQITNVCKLEHMQGGKFAQDAYGNEALARVVELREIHRRAQDIMEHLPAAEQDAFFQLILMKFAASYLVNASFYFADRSKYFYEKGAMQSADLYAQLSRKMDAYKRSMLAYYNKVMQNGKWDGILTPESFSPPPMALYPLAKPALFIGETKLGVGAEPELCFTCSGSQEKKILLWNEGAGSVPYFIIKPEWLESSAVEGDVFTDQTIRVRIAEEYREKAYTEGLEGRLAVGDGRKWVKEIKVKTEVGKPAADGAAERSLSGRTASQSGRGATEHMKNVHAETDGYVVIPAEGYAADPLAKPVADSGEEGAGTSVKGCAWRLLKGLGRGFGDAIESRVSLPYPEKSTALNYNIYLENSGEFLLEIQRYVTLNSTGSIRFALCIDGGDLIHVQSEITDEWRGGWRDAVMDDGEKLFVRLPYLAQGFHRLSLLAWDKYVTITKLIIYTKERKESNLGPVPEQYVSAFIQNFSVFEEECSVSEEKFFSFEEEYSALKEYFSSPEKECSAFLEKIAMMESGDICEEYFDCNGEMFRTKTQHLPMLYADEHFYEINRLYICSDEIAQTELGEKRYQPDSAGKKDVVAEFGSGVFMEKDGVLALEAEYVLEETKNAYTTKSAQGEAKWSHTQAQTDGESGLAMYLEGTGHPILAKEDAPGMHYRIHIKNAGEYRIWLLVKFDDHMSDGCYLALDGEIQDVEKQFSKGNLFTYCMKQRWNWQCVSKMEFAKGEHIFSVYGRKNGLRIDRIYISMGGEWPPVDKEWRLSVRRELSENGILEAEQGQ